MRAFQAYAKPLLRATAETPRAAAEKFFSAFPEKRKCNIIEGESDGMFFTTVHQVAGDGAPPRSWNNVTKKTAAVLPEE